MIPYTRHCIDQDDIDAVTRVLKSDRLTQGREVGKFEREFAEYVGARWAVAVSSGTAALHLALLAHGVGPGDEVITSPISFVATANAILYCGAKPVFADIDPWTGLMDWEQVQLVEKTKVVLPVHYAGQAGCDHYFNCSVPMVEDACHALGAEYRHKRIGGMNNIAAFSTHAAKHITTGEGGVVTGPVTGEDMDIEARRDHGRYFWGPQDRLGFNYRMTEFQAALGRSQLRKADLWLLRRRTIAAQYDAAFEGTPIKPLSKRECCNHAYHLYVVKVKNRASVRKRLLADGIETQVHYMPIYLHPYYQTLGYKQGLCPKAERFARNVLSLPMYPTLTDAEVAHVIKSTRKAVGL